MTEWNPLNLFAYSVGLSALTALGALLRSDKPLTIRTILGTLVFHGTMGGGLGMAAYEYLNWQERPWRVLSTAIGYGGGVITFKWIQDFVKQNVARIGLPNPGEQDKP